MTTMKKNNPLALSIIIGLLCIVTAYALIIDNAKLVLLFTSLIFFTVVMQIVIKNTYSFQSNKDDVKKPKFNEVYSTNIRYDSVAGMEEIKAEIEEISDFLTHPDKYKKFGATIPKGVLFYGPPGTGKTLLARALATECQAHFIYASGSEFIEKFVGVGANRIRALFDKASKKTPCIVFIDEIDAIGVSRNSDNNSERDQTLNQLLIELDGFNQNEGIVIIGATNRIDILDVALLRPGRFDRQIYIGNPSIRAREKILNVHFKNKPIAKEVDLKKIATKTSGMSGAHLANLANESALIAIRNKRKHISNEDLNEAIIKTSAGLKNANLVLTEKEKDTISIHESAHALIECYCNNTVPERITIIPHGQSLGFMMPDQEEEKVLISKEDMQNKICVLLAGRVAEEFVFNHINTGSQNDLERANEIAKNMVCTYGMSKYKNRTFTDNFSTIRQINDEITIILDECYLRTQKIISDNIDTLTHLATKLKDKEILRKNEISEILTGVLV